MLIMAEVYDEPLALHHLQLPNTPFKASTETTKKSKRDVVVEDEQGQLESHASQAMGLLQRALNEDVPLSVLMDTIEKEVLMTALNRHKTFSDLHDALDISRSAMDGKRRKYKI